MAGSHYQCFDVSIEDDVAHFVLNRPEKRNSMIPAFWEELPKAIEKIDDNAEARAIVISSTGPVFSAGMDLAAFAPREPGDKDEARRNRIRHGAAFTIVPGKPRQPLTRLKIAVSRYSLQYKAAA